MEKIREFGILKWLVFPSMSLTLAGIVAWFNVTIFGWVNGAFYILAVVIIALFSIAINKYVGSPFSRLGVAAFCFELALILVLGANAVYSLSVQREMAVARMSEQTDVEAIREIKQLKSRQAQRDATRKVVGDKKDGKSSQAVFAENERMLLWLMAGEMLAYIVAAFTLYALSHLVVPKRETSIEERPTVRPSISAPPPMRRPVIRPSFVEAKKADSKPREHLKLDTEKRAEKLDTSVDAASTNSAGLAALRDVLKTISFRLKNYSFKVDIRSGVVWIRLMHFNGATQDTAASVSAQLSILDDVMRMPEDAFRERLERFLRKNEFSI